MTVNDIIAEIESLAPIAYQESFDNTGLTVGEPNQQVSAVLICFDVTEKIIDEAIERNADLIISHHPVIFKGIKQLNGKTPTERIVTKAIKHNIALYAAHTNLDNAWCGINARLSDKIGLINQQVLIPKKDALLKLVTFVPTAHADNVRSALFTAKAGEIGNYDCCSYSTTGYGTFRAGDNTNPFVGEKGQIHNEQEVRVETIVKRHLLSKTINALLQSHPYEEVAYDIYPLNNILPNVGLGRVGNLPQPIPIIDFLKQLKQLFSVTHLRYSEPNIKHVSRVAVCGGSGSEFINDAIRAKADVYITGDCKYHQFIDAAPDILLIDIGHYESEYFATEIFYELLSKKFPNFAVYLAKNSLNPINYI